MMTHSLISKEGLEILRDKLTSLKNAYRRLSRKLIEARQLKDGDGLMV